MGDSPARGEGEGDIDRGVHVVGLGVWMFVDVLQEFFLPTGSLVHKSLLVLPLEPDVGIDRLYMDVTGQVFYLFLCLVNHAA